MLRIITIADLTWQNGLEYALDGVRMAIAAGVAVNYEIIGRGSMLEALGYAVHEMGLAEICQIRTRKQGRIQSDVFLLPAVAPVPGISGRPSVPKNMRWIVTDFSRAALDSIQADCITVVSPWDSQGIADALISLAQRKMN